MLAIFEGKPRARLVTAKKNRSVAWNTKEDRSPHEALRVDEL